MIRTVVSIICIVCVATVLTEILGVTYMYVSGQLNPTSVNAIQLALKGEVLTDSQHSDIEEVTPPSADDIIKARSNRVWDLKRRQQELSILKSLVTDNAQKLTAMKATLKKEQEDFQKQLQQISQTNSSDSIGQSRGILLKMSPEDATTNLMALSLEQNVILLKGLPDKSTATILQQFLASNNPAQAERGRKIFEAITKGEPTQTVLNQTQKKLQNGGGK